MMANATILLSEVLFHFLWQGALLGLIALFASSLLQRRQPARAWYASQVLILIAMVACPILTAAVLARPVDKGSIPGIVEPMRHDLIATEASAHSTDSEPATPTESIPASAQAPASDLPGSSSIPPPTQTPDDSIAVALPILPASPPDRGVVEPVRFPPVDMFAPYIALAYSLGCLLMLTRLAIGVHGGQRLRKHADPVTDGRLLDALKASANALGLTYVPALAYCSRVAVPTVVGIVRPMILLPIQVQTGFTIAQLELILSHELAHIRRYDHIVNILQRFAEAVLFFHPTVWYVSRQIALAREHCCDDLVLELGGAPDDYARLLLQAEEHARNTGAPVAALTATGHPSQLRRRIARILGTDLPVKLGRTGVLTISATVLIAATGLAVLAVAPDDDPVADTIPEANTQILPTLELDRTQLAQAEPDDPPPPDTSPNPPEEARQDLIEQLSGAKDSWLRKIAAQEAGESRNSAYVSHLIDVLTDNTEEPEVRAAAATALGQIADPDAVPYLVASLRFYGPISDAAVNAVARIDDPSVLSLLERAVNDRDDLNIRFGAYNALAQIGSDEAVQLLLDYALTDPSPPIEILVHATEKFDLSERLAGTLEQEMSQAAQTAFQVLVRTGTDEARDVVVTALTERDFEPTQESLVQNSDWILNDEAILAALAGLVADGVLSNLDPGATRWIAEGALERNLLALDPKQAARLYVAAGKFDVVTRYGRVALEPLLDALKLVDPSVEYRGNSLITPILNNINALRELGDPRTIPHLAKLFNIRETDFAVSAVNAVGEIGTDAAVPALIRALESPHPSVRSRAASYLGNLDVNEAVEPLIRSLDDLEMAVQREAAESLGEIGDSRAVPALIDSLEEGDHEVRRAAIIALEAIGDTRAVPALIDSLEEGDQRNDHRVAEALGELGDRRAVPALTKALYSAYDPVAAEAAKALGQIGGPDAIESLVGALGAGDSDLRGDAYRALERMGPPNDPVPALLDAVESLPSDRQFAFHLVGTLGTLGDSRAVPKLIEIFETSPDEDIRGKAASSLGVLGDPAAVPPLVAYLERGLEPDPTPTDPDTVSSVVRALGNIGDPSALPVVREIAKLPRHSFSAHFVNEANTAVRKIEARADENPDAQ